MTLQYLESVVASTAVICEEIGVMMYERQYITFAESIEGGRMSVVQATLQWSEWLNTALEKNATWPPSDLKGPSGQRRILGQDPRRHEVPEQARTAESNATQGQGREECK